MRGATGMDLRQEGQAEPVRHHLHQRRQRGRAERVDRVGLAQLAKSERLMAQAVPLLEQQQPVVLDELRWSPGRRLSPGGRAVARA